MPLSEAQRKAVLAEAERRGIDPQKLLAAAEAEVDAGRGPQAANPPDDAKAEAATSKSAPAKDPKLKPPLYQYHLPFVTVNEVRTIWLELPPMDGGDVNAAKYAAMQLASDTPALSSSNDETKTETDGT